MSALFHLRRHDELLGILRVQSSLHDAGIVETAMPFIACAFDPAPAFERVRPLFERELALLEANQVDAWADAYEAIMLEGITLTTPDGAPVDVFVIHIRGQRAWFRY